jgi:hypothetical protein
MLSPTTTFADASLFMGMHSSLEATRIACKNFFVQRIGKRLIMTLDQVGLCDDIVWRKSRHLQDLYYPFMDQLHSLLAAERVPYSRTDIRRAHDDPRTRHLDGLRALLIARVCNDQGVLYTADPVLLNRPDLPVQACGVSAERAFPEPIEAAYQMSLAFRMDPAMAQERETACCVG